jgi:phosphomannomutase
MNSISGFRGTLGGRSGDNLTPPDIIRFSTAFAGWIRESSRGRKIVIGRDARASGEILLQLVAATLRASGLDIVDLGLSTTPTVEMAVLWEAAAGGIVLTASHNPGEWNALKLLNHRGEFLDARDGARILELAAREDFDFAPADALGRLETNDRYLTKHIESVLDYPLVNRPAIRTKGFRIVVDVINSTGSLCIPALLEGLGVAECRMLNSEMNGKFAHDPEPLPENLSELSAAVRKGGADLGIAVDPDVDRLCFVCEDGSMFGEEYTLVAVADYVLERRPGNTVSNMSSTKALMEITLKRGGRYFPSAVGEVNVVQKMKEVGAVIGGEGNGGIIVPDLHYGRDALIGIGLFLSALSTHRAGIRSFRAQYPDYFISKNKMALEPGVDIPGLFEKIRRKYPERPANTEDGLKIEFENDWVHLRPSNTEPILRIYAESGSQPSANQLAERLMGDIREMR